MSWPIRRCVPRQHSWVRGGHRQYLCPFPEPDVFSWVTTCVCLTDTDPEGMAWHPAGSPSPTPLWPRPTTCSLYRLQSRLSNEVMIAWTTLLDLSDPDSCTPTRDAEAPIAPQTPGVCPPLLFALWSHPVPTPRSVHVGLTWASKSQELIFTETTTSIRHYFSGTGKDAGAWPQRPGNSEDKLQPPA